MDHSKCKINVLDIALASASMFFLLGMLFLFGPCGPKEDGGWMTCHWAGNVITGLAGVLLAISLIRLAIPKNQVKLGLSLAIIPVSGLACLIPGRIISMCMMRDMRCHAVMAPAVTIFSLLLIGTSVIDIAAAYRRNQ